MEGNIQNISANSKLGWYADTFLYMLILFFLITRKLYRFIVYYSAGDSTQGPLHIRQVLYP